MSQPESGPLPPRGSRPAQPAGWQGPSPPTGPTGAARGGVPSQVEGSGYDPRYGAPGHGGQVWPGYVNNPVGPGHPGPMSAGGGPYQAMPGQAMPGQAMPGPGLGGSRNGGLDAVMPGQPMPGQPMPGRPMPGQPPNRPSRRPAGGSSQQLPMPGSGSVMGGAQPVASGSRGGAMMLAGSGSVMGGAAPVANGSGEAPPGYEFLGELGRGGMGVVYKARDLRIGRVVALKMLLSGGYASAKDLERFELEAAAVGRLNHPNIVAIYEVGNYRGLPYFSLEFCEGGTLAAKLSGRPMPARPAAVLIEIIARAVDAAHRQGVIHRDLKPANILLTAEGTPKLTDFGLAKRMDSAGPTATGASMGTPAYMSPEQVEGGRGIGPATDIYGLGAVLYEMLTGRPPFLGESEVNTIWMVLSQDPVAVRELSARVPRDLETICLKCLAKLPGRRYPSALELADDLQRFLTGQAIKARPVGRVEQLTKWARRNPLVAGMASLSVVALVALVAIGMVFSTRMSAANRRLSEQFDELQRRQIEALTQRDKAESESRRASQAVDFAERQRLAAEANLLEAQEQRRLARDGQNEARRQGLLAQRNRYLACARLAGQAFAEGRLAVVSDLLDQMRPRPGEPDLRGFEWAHLQARCQRPLAIFEGQRNGRMAIGLAWSPDGRTLAVGGNEPSIRLFDVAAHRELATLASGEGDVFRLSFSPDGRQMVSASSASEPVLTWPIEQILSRVRNPPPGGAQLTDLSPTAMTRHGQWIGAASFSPDGRLMASLGQDKYLRVWSIAENRELLTLEVVSIFGFEIAWSPDSRRLATIGCDLPATDARIRIVDIASAAVVAEMPGHQAMGRGLAWSADSQLLMSGGADGMVRFWDITTARQLAAIVAHNGLVTAVKLSPDGRLAVSTALDGTVRLWDVANRADLGTIAFHRGGVFDAVFSPDGRQLATSCVDGLVRLWAIPAIRKSPPAGNSAPAKAATATSPQLTVNPETVVRRSVMGLALAVSPDGQTLAVAGGIGGAIDLFETATMTKLRRLDGHLVFTTGLAFSPDGRTLASASPLDSEIRLWSVSDGRRAGQVPTLSGVGATIVRFSPDGRQLAFGGVQGQLCIQDLATNQPVRNTNSERAALISLAYSPDGRRLATVSINGYLRVWDAATGAMLAAEARQHVLPMSAVAFARDGQTLFAACADGLVRIHQTDTLTRVGEIRGGNIVLNMTLSPDGQVLVCVCVDGAILLFDAATGQERGTLRGHTNMTIGVAFDPAGQALYTTSIDATIRVWRAIDEGQLLNEARAAMGWAPTPQICSEAVLIAWGRYLERYRANDMAQAKLAVDFAAEALERLLKFAGAAQETYAAWKVPIEEARAALAATTSGGPR